MAERSGFWALIKRVFRRKRADRHIVHHRVNVQRVWGDPREEKWRSVDFEAAKGVTRDMSATGVYFETDLNLHEGSMIRFTIDFDAPTGGERTRLECQGHVVRAESSGAGKIGIAVRLDDQHLRVVQ